jgi:hypothetical protein
MTITDKQVRSTLRKALKLRREGQTAACDELFTKLVKAGIRISMEVGTPIKNTVIHRVAAAGK